MSITNTHLPLRHALMCGAAIATFAIPHAAVAQTTPADAPPAAEAEADDGADIVVTARYREENLRDIPLAVTALQGDRLEDLGIRNLREIIY